MTKQIKTDVCAFCGKREKDHCPFYPVMSPPSCVCNTREWENPAKIPLICKKFRGVRTSTCLNCEHNYECHEEFKACYEETKTEGKQCPKE